MSTIICPSCNKVIELSEALKHQLEGEVLSVEREKHQKELEEAKKQTSAVAFKELTLLKDDMRKKEQLLKEAQDAELAIRKVKNQLEEERRSFELEKQRQLDAEREKIRQKTTNEVLEQQRMKEKEKDKVIDDLKKSLEEAQRKATQGSQQLQGEVQELDLEQLFRQSFPQDTIEEVGKGVLGADIRHIVKSPLGTVCGTILWESKRTKSWSDSWITKLKGDVLLDKAHVSAIVTEALPEEAKSGMGYKDGVWVASPKLAVALALLLRKQLLEVTKQKKIDENKQSKSESLYAFVTSHEFQHQVEEMIAIYMDMQQQITKERTQAERLWKLRESQVQRLLSGVSGIIGTMQGSVGNALPTLKGLEIAQDDLQS